MSMEGEGRVAPQAARRFAAARTFQRGVRVAPALGAGLALTFALALVGALARVVVPVLIQQVIDGGFRDGEVRVGWILRTCAAAAIVIAASAVALRAAVRRLGTQAERGLYALRVRLYEHIHRLSLESHREERRGALVSRVTSDIETLTMFFAWGGLTFMLDGALMLAVAAVMLAYDWMLALVALGTSAPLFLVLRRLQARLVAAYEHARGRNAVLLAAVSELVAGTETLRAAGAHAPLLRRTRHAVRERADAQIRAGVIGAFLFPSGEVFAAFTVTAVVAVGALRGLGDGLTAGSMVGFYFLTYRFLEPIAEFTEVVDQAQTAVAGLRRVLGVLDTPVGPPAPASPSALPAGPLSVGLHEVTFAYAPRDALVGDSEEQPALRDVTLEIPARQHVALVGESGSGKTTLARLVARFADPTAGTVLVGGVNLRRVDNVSLRRRLVVVPQEPFLFADTIAGNLRFASPDAGERSMRDAAERLGMLDWIDELPSGFATPVGQRGAALSAGERQLVALLRASMTSPDVLILDEATSAVDPLLETRIAAALRALSDGRTTIAIAHRLSTAARADRVLVLHEGRLVEDGRHEDLLARGGTYARMYGQWLDATAA
ncbi:MAG: ABC transporter ATP-binding protein [Acidimicrobiia bacterium]